MGIESVEMIGKEKLPTTVFEDDVTASKVVADEIVALINRKEDAVLGLCAGSTPKKVYKNLIETFKEKKVSFAKVRVFLLDEYYPINLDDSESKWSDLKSSLFDHIDITFDNIYHFDGTLPNSQIKQHCTEYDKKISSFGGFDFLLLGIGATAHIAANEPGTPFSSKSRKVPLDKVTRIGAASHFRKEERVPRFALTIGLSTIMLAKRVALLAFGEGKAKVVKKMIEEEATPLVPASIIQKIDNAHVYLDTGASSELGRVKNPWLYEECNWYDERFVRKAVIWLCERVDKPILKLTNRDYMDNGMGDLIAVYGSAYSVNIKIFNEIQAIITGWPGGKPYEDSSKRPERDLPYPKKVLVFSPHPDDDVISMGGTLIRLVDQGHEVHVAYQTNGNVAVADDKVQDLVDLLRILNNEAKDIISITGHRLDDIESFLSSKDLLDVDINEVQYIKGLIRKVETMSACRYVGIPLERNHHLDLPFYHTGAIKKKPLSQDDIDIVKNLLQEIKPHQIFAAGDLSDPHGTHRVCLDAIFAALDQLKGEEWLEDCRVWLYRGAWAEWPVDEADMAVPISPEELMRKRISIFKHGSQKDGIVFPGSDSREFWQRAEDRNRGTAQLFDKLGFAEYEAIELFVRYRDFEQTSKEI